MSLEERLARVYPAPVRADRDFRPATPGRATHDRTHRSASPRMKATRQVHRPATTRQLTRRDRELLIGLWAQLLDRLRDRLISHHGTRVLCNSPRTGRS